MSEDYIDDWRFNRLGDLTSSDQRTALFALRDTLAEKLVDPGLEPGVAPNLAGKFLKVLEAIEKHPAVDTAIDPLDSLSAEVNNKNEQR